MGLFTGKEFADIYRGIINVSDDNTGITSTKKTLQTAEGTDSKLQLSTTAVNIVSGFEIGGTAVNPSATELNYVQNVTSAIQTQLNTATTAIGLNTTHRGLSNNPHTVTATQLSLVIGTNTQAHDAGLDSLAALTYSSDSFIKVTATDTYVIRTIAQTKTDLSLNNVENTAVSTWAGTTNITTLGTIATGTWSATTIAVNKGGTGQTSYTNGQLLIGNTSGNTLTKATLTGTADQITVTNSTGSITLSTPQDIAAGSSPTFAGLALGSGNLTLTGSIATTTNKATKVWTTNLEITNDPTINGTAMASIYAAIAQTFYIGTTQVAINRASATLNLAGIGTLSCGAITSTGKFATTLTTEQMRLNYDATNYAHFTVDAEGRLTITTVDDDAAEGDIILAPDGNVGIGTASPSVALDVNGNISSDNFKTSITNQYVAVGDSTGVGGTFTTHVGIETGQNNVETKTTGIGYRALINNTGTRGNALGYQALATNSGAYAVGMGFVTARGNTGDYITALGSYALENNSGDNAVGVGAYALQDNSVNNVVGVGYFALQDNSGGNSTGVGHYALEANTGSDVAGFGFQSLQNNTGHSSAGTGMYSLQNNTGHSASGLGYGALRANTGTQVSGFGYKTLRDNVGNQSTASGFESSYYNTGAFSVSSGFRAMRMNIGDYSIGIGAYALQYNKGHYNTAIGDNAFNTFTEDAGSAVEITTVDFAQNRMVKVGHGFSGYVNLKASTTGVLPTGLTTAVNQWQVIDADTLYCRTATFSDAGSGTHTLTPQVSYTNSTAIGYNAEPDANNQIILGNSSVTEVKTAGAITSAGKFSTTLTSEQMRLSYDADNYATWTVAADGALTIVTVDDSAAAADINFEPDGNVGIKTAAPSEALEVTGNIKVSGTVDGKDIATLLGATPGTATASVALIVDASKDITLGTGDLTATNLTGTLQTAAQTNITSVGALGGGSITSGFGAIDIGADNLTATGTISLGATAFNDGNLTDIGTIVVSTSDNYVMEGYSSGRNVMRVFRFSIGGLTDNTQVTLRTLNIWNGEALAIETVDSDTPTGGTRFDISADGLTATIKGLTPEVVGVWSAGIVFNDTGTAYIASLPAESSGDITCGLRDATSGAAIDLTSIANTKVVQFIIVYITST